MEEWKKDLQVEAVKKAVCERESEGETRGRVFFLRFGQTVFF